MIYAHFPIVGQEELLRIDKFFGQILAFVTSLSSIFGGEFLCRVVEMKFNSFQSFFNSENFWSKYLQSFFIQETAMSLEYWIFVDIFFQLGDST